MFGILTLQSFVHGPVETFGALTVVGAAVAIVVALTYFKRWKWLWSEWLTSLDPKRIGIMYIVLSFAMMGRGLIDALMMRGQQAASVGDIQGFLSPDHFAQIFTAHGVIMILFMAMPLVFGFLNLIVPLQIGARDVAFPFLNATSLWLTVGGAMLLNLSLVVGAFGAAGWLAYPPLSELQYSPGVGMDYYIWAIQIAGVGSLLSAVNFTTTIVKLRAPGLTMMHLPIFVWTSLCSMILVLFAFPILTVTLAMLSLDRTLGMHFFTTDLGGNAMLYVNLIWAWGHPEVYILILPAFGIFSEIVPVFSQKKLFGYTSMVVATVLIMLLSFVVWLHHFFTMGAGADVNAFFGIATMAIAIPTGVKIFNWLFTMFRGRIIFSTPMLWFFGFLISFTIGGMSGVLLAVPGVDFQFHNSLFLVAHFHNVIIGGVVFGFFAGIIYWFPKFIGFSLNEKIGTWAFWTWIVGFVLAFSPLYILGIMGMTRRLYSVDAAWHPLLVVAAIGALVITLALALQVWQVIVSIKERKHYRVADPWNGRTLEWSTASPVPFYNFARIPQVHGRDALWMQKKMKESGTRAAQTEYEDIEMPRNTPMGMLVAFFAFLLGFGIVWHMWWLALLGFICIPACCIIRSFENDTEYTISAAEIARLESNARHV